MLLRSEFPNGPFGDPALYIWNIQNADAMLLDCGDLSRFTPRQLLRTGQIYLSHCHMDHFFGFDLFLRVQMSAEKKVMIFGPPGTSDRVQGKLSGYTWNLVMDHDIEFQVVDLDPVRGRRQLTRFLARNRFQASDQSIEPWDPRSAVHDAGIFQVHASPLDHHTISLAYAVDEKPGLRVDRQRLRQLGLVPGPWIEKLKSNFLFGERNSAGAIEVSLSSGDSARWEAEKLSEEILIAKQRHKIVYATDGATSPANRERLIELARDADLFYCETCFMERDRAQAEATRHFTAAFIGDLAREAGVHALIPFHFSKRYVDRKMSVLKEVREHFGGQVLDIAERIPEALLKAG